MMRFIVRFVVPVLAAGLFAVALIHVLVSNRPPPVRKTRVADPPVTDFEDSVAAAGIVESQTENIAVGSPVPGVVEEIYVQVGRTVKAGDALFRLRTRELQAQLAVRRAAVAAAQAQYDRLKSLPRKEEVPVKQAAVSDASATMEQKQGSLARVEAAFKKQSVTPDELATARRDFETAKAQYEKAVAELKLLKAGSSPEELAVAKAAVEQAKADAAATQTDIDRRTITALVNGEVLQVNIRPGEFVGAPPNETLILLGNTKRLHVRVDIDEHDIPRFVPGAKAEAMLRGFPRRKFPLTFVRVEPYVIPKKSLTGDNRERVDTRVLQVIYEIDAGRTPLYVGQQMDVFIRAGSEPAAGNKSPDGQPSGP